MAHQLAHKPSVRLADRLQGRKVVRPLRKKAAATILLVEHHPLFRKLIKKILEDAQFTVLAAQNPKEAKHIEGSFAGKIDLLLSEVMMAPGLLGTKLATALKGRRPKMRILLMSAYPGGELLILNYGWHFIAHPFMAEALVGRIKAVLRSKVRAHDIDHFDTRK